MEINQILDKATECFKNKQYHQVIQLLHPIQPKLEDVNISKAVTATLGKAYYKQDQAHIALRYFEELIEKHPNDKEPYYLAGICAMSLNKQHLAQQYFKKSLELKPNQPSCILNLAASYRQSNQSEMAIPYYQTLAKIESYQSRAYRNMSMCKDYASLEDPDYKAIQKILSQSELTHEQQSHFYFALGKIYQDCQMPNEAFSAYHKANQLKNDPRQFNSEDYSKKLNELIELFTNIHYPELNREGDPNFIFVLGIPRGGKTLLEKVLSLSQDVCPLEEFAVIDKLAYLFTQNRPFRFSKELRDKLESNHFNQNFYEAFYQKIIARTDEVYPAFVDTTPCNFRYMGYIYGMAPRAKFIHVYRNPLDHIFTIYTKYFSTGNFWAFNLRNIVHYYCGYRHAMAFWEKALPCTIETVHYEDLIQNPLETATKLFDITSIKPPEDLPEQLNSLHLTSKEINIHQQYPDFMQELSPYLKELEPYL